uniref:Uncharacterized protein n=1 Tax=Oryza glumipatula TaxID=40148 RepID=A0A0D9YZI8_9ORYZ
MGLTGGAHARACLLERDALACRARAPHPPWNGYVKSGGERLPMHFAIALTPQGQHRLQRRCRVWIGRFKSLFSHLVASHKYYIFISKESEIIKNLVRIDQRAVPAAAAAEDRRRKGEKRRSGSGETKSSSSSCSSSSMEERVKIGGDGEEEEEAEEEEAPLEVVRAAKRRFGVVVVVGPPPS